MDLCIVLLKDQVNVLEEVYRIWNQKKLWVFFVVCFSLGNLTFLSFRFLTVKQV